MKKIRRKLLSVTLSGLMMVNSFSNFMIVAEDGNTADHQEETVTAEEQEQTDETVPEVSSEDIKETDTEPEPETTEEPEQTPEPAEETPAAETPSPVPEETEEPEPVDYTLTFSASDNGGIVLSSSKPADGSNAKSSQTQKIETASQLVTVWALPDDGYEFDHWEKNNQAFETKEAAKIQAEDLKLLNNDSFTAVFKQKVPAKEEEPEPAEIRVEETSSINAALAEASDTWTVTFYNRDAIVHQTASVKKGQPIGDQLPAVIEREDYNAYWAIGEIVQGGQGNEIKVTGARIDASWIPEADTVLVPDYDLITYTVTFYTDEIKTDVLETKTVNVNTSYCLNDIPAVPQKTGYTGKWVYSRGDFNNSVAMKEDTDVWASYEQNVFTAVFKVEDETYQTDTYYYGDTLTLPAAPVVTGRDFAGWYADGTKYEGGEAVTSDLTLTAAFEDQYRVDFVIVNDAGEETIYLTQHFDSAGETISQLPQAPFAAGKEFLRWVNRETGEEITADTVVNGNITAVAEFRKLKVYNIKAEYYYESLNNPGREVIFNIDDIQVEEHELPYTITAPSSTQTDEDEVPKAPIYYPENPTAEITKESFGDGDTYKVRFKYIPFTATYDYVYLLKDLDGSGYTEIDRTEDVNGVLGSYVTPAVKTFDYAVLENAEGATIIQAEGQELKVYYTRKNFQLTYDTQGGSYVGGVTVPYGTEQAVTSTRPTREGYSFGGWYLDAACTQPAGSSVTVEQNTTLYAKWTGDTVNYTIIYLKEQYDNSTGTTSYVYERSNTGTGRVGSTVYAASAPSITLNGYEKLASINGTTSSAGTGDSTAVTITADGSTVLKVYLSLIRYTLVFNANQGTIRIDGRTYTGTNYQIKDVVLGQEIGSKWPASSTEIYRNNRYFDGWTGGPSTYITKQYELVWNHVSRANQSHVMTFTASWDNSSYDRNAYYWLQQPDGTYKIEPNYTQIGLNTNNLGAKEIDGYSKHNGTPSGYPESGDAISSVTQNNSGYYVRDDNKSGGNYRTYYEFEGHLYRLRDSSWPDYMDYGKTRYNVTMTYTYHFYYDRAQYKIDYYYGSTKLTTKDNIYFEADISGSEYDYVPARPNNIDSDYTWGGWYSDAGLQTKYVFGTMPGNNLVLYARWIAPVFTVRYVDGDNTATVYETKTDVAKYSKVSALAVNPVKDGYIFEGWFTEADGDTLFDWNTQIQSDTTIYAHWTRKTLSYTVHYISEDGEKLADDKIVSHPNLEVGQSVTESALAIAGYRPDKNSASITLSETDSDNEITFVYSSKTETTGYRVRYLLDPEEYPGNIQVAEDKVVTGISGDVASHIETAVEVDYEALYAAHPELRGIEFFPDAVEKTLVLTAREENNILTFYYSGFKNATVTVRFVDMDNQPIAADDVRSMKVGNTFTLSRTPIAGWELNKAVEGESYNGTEAGNSYKITESVTAHGLTFTLFYQKKATITAVSLSRQYNGTVLSLPESLTDQVMTEGLLEGDTLTSVSFTYTNNDSSAPEGRLNAGVATVKPGNAVISGHTSSNYYAIRYISGTLEVTKINVTIRIEPDRWTGNVYDGMEKKTGFTNASKSVGDYIIISHEGYKNSYLSQIWDAVKAKAVYDESASGLHYYGIAEKDAGDYAFNVGLTLADLPADPNYSVSLFIRPGRLQILPKDVTVTTGSAEKTYDGTPLTENTITVEGIVAGETYKAETTGTITNPGSTDNTYSITWAAEGNTYTAKHSNYNVTHNLGTLTVNEAVLKVTVKDTEKVYNGSEQEGLAFTASVTGTGNTIETDDYVIEGLGKDDVLTITYTPATGTNAGTYTGSFAESYTITRDGNDVKASYGTPTFTAGKLTITPKEVTIEADNKFKRYDNDPSTDPALTATVTGAVEGETINYTLSREEGQNAGDYTITVTAGENPNYTVKTVDGTFTITPKEITIKADNKTKEYDNNTSTDPELTATVTGAVAGDTVSYTLSRKEGQNAGEYTITVTAGENPNYTVKTVDGTFTITPKEITIKADNKTKEYDNNTSTDPELTATVTGAVAGDTVSYTLSRTAGQDAGSYPITVTAGENPNYTVNTEGGTFTITPADLTVAVTGNTDTKTYNGSEQSVSGYTISIPEGSTLTEAEIKGPAQAAAKGTDAGTYAIGLTADAFSTENRNYNVKFTVTDGWLKITKAPLTITVKDQTYDYNGEPQGENNAVYTDDAKVTVTGLQGTDALTGITLNGQETNAGEYPGKITAADAVIGDKTDNYEITYTPGKLTIRPIDVTVTITGHNDTATYDGAEHSVSGYDVEISNSLYKESDFTFTGTASAARTEVGTTNMNLTANQFANNNANFGTVTFNVIDGYQTITPVDEIIVTITGHHNTADYDGSEHTARGYDVTISNPLYKVSDFTFSGTAEAKRTDAGTTNMGLAPEQFTNTNTNFQKVTFVVTDGYQTINPINVTVTITGANNTADYDGAEHTVTGYTATASTNLYDVTKDFTFSGTAEAARTDVGTTNMGLTAEQFANTNPNFGTVTFNVTDGYQTINPIDVTVTIVGANNTTDYDGTEHTVTGYTATAGTNLYDVTKDFTFSGTAEAKRTDAGTTNMGLTSGQFTNTNTNFKTVTFEVTDGYQTINPIDVTVTIVGANNTADYDGEEHTVTGYTATTDNALYDVTKDFTFTGTAEAKRTNAGTTNMGLAANQFANTNTNFKTVTFEVTDGYQTINPIDVTVTIVGENNTTDYDGVKHTVTGYTATASTPLYDVTKDFTFSGTAEAERTAAGTTNMGLAAEQFTNTNTNFKTVTFDVTDGYQTINPIDVVVTIVGNNNTTDYDGEEHTVSGYTATASTELFDVSKDFRFTGTAEAKRTAAGTTNMGLAADQFSNQNNNFANVTFNVTDGYQTINPINVTVTITGVNNTTDYDGEEHTVTGYTATADNNLYDVTKDFTFSGTAEAARTDVGTTNMGLAAEQFANTNPNFGAVTFNVTDGYQTINPIDIVVTITGHNNTTDYDGEEHSVSGYDVAINNPLYTEADFTFSGTAEAKRTDAGTTEMGLTADQFANANANFKTVTFNVTDGYQTINPIDVTVTIVGSNNTTDYDGEAHTVTGYTATASTELYDVTKDFTFSGTAEAVRTEAGTTVMGLNASQFSNINNNFKTVTFNVTDGYQTINPIDVTVTIVGANNTTDYDGEEHSVSGYTATADNPLYDVTKDFTFSGTAEVKRTDAGTTKMNLAADQFANTNKNFRTVTFNVTDGYQTINPIDVTVTIVGASNTTDYDGKEHTVTGYTATADSDLYDVTKDFTFSGTAEAKRTDAGTTKMNLAADQFANTNKNFKTVTFNVTDGYQTITPINVTVTIVGNNNTTDYDGKEHTVTGYTATADNDLYDVTKDFSFNGSSSATRTDAGTTNMGLAADQFTNTNPNFGTVTFNVTDGHQTINPINVTVTIIGNNNTTNYDGAEHKVTGYKATADNTLYNVEKDFTFSGTAEAARTDAGTTNMGLAAEQFTNTNPNFGTVTFSVTDGYQKIDPIDVTVTIVGANNTIPYDGEPHTTTGYTATADNPLYDVTKDFTFSGNASASRTDAGTTNMGLTADQFTNTNPNFSTVTFKVTDGYQTVNPIDITVTITGHNDTTVYDGAEHSVSGYDVEICNPLYTEADFTFNGTAEAARTDVGTTNMGLASEQFANTNPNFAEVTFKVTDGYQTIAPVDEVIVTITGHHNTTDFDGNEHSVSGYDVEISNPLYAEADFTFSGTAEAKRTDAGTTNMGLAADQFTNTNPNFAKVTFNVTDGYQAIDPIDVTVTITGHNSSLPFDGTEHSVSGYDVSISNHLYTEADFTFTGTASAERTDVGTTNMDLKPEQFENKNGNFKRVTFEVTDGYQTITPIDVTVTITGHNNTTDYDGKEHTVTGYDVQISNSLYTEADFTFSGTAEAKRTDAGTTNMGLAESQFTNTNTNFGKVTFVVTDGYQTITPIDVVVTITGASNTAAYDGGMHTVSGYTATASTDLYDVEKDFTFSGKAEASRTDAGTTNMGLAAGQFTNTNPNFGTVTFIVTDGYQTITPIGVTVTITEHSKEADYDGKEHTVTGYDVSISNPLYKEADFTFSGNDSVSGTNAGSYDMELKPEDFANTNSNFTNVTFEIVDGQLVIKPIDITVTITEHSDEVNYDGAEHTVTGYEVEIKNPLYTEADFTFSGNASVSGTEAGSYDMELKPEEFTNTNSNFANVTFVIVDGQLVIKPIDVTVTIAGHTNTADYDGAEHKVTGYDVQIDNPLYTEADFTFSGTAEAARKDVGTTNMGLTAEQFTNTNKNFKTVTFNVTDGYQTIDPIDVTVTITGANNTTDYDGAEHKVTGYTATANNDLYDVTKDFTFSGTAEASRTDVGTTNMGLAADQFANTNANFKTVTFNVTDGYQAIDPIDVTVTITGANNTTDYDGAEHKVTGYTATANNDLYDVTKDFTFSGTAEASRTDVGTTNMGLTAEQFVNINTNFKTVTFNVTDGYQTITPIDVTVTIKGHNNTATYDALPHSVSGYDVQISNPLYKETDFTFTGTAEASRTPVGTTNMGLAADQFVNKNTNFGTVTFNVTDGYQTIAPVDEIVVTITGHNNATDYDGEEHKVTGYDVQISNPLYTEADFTFSGNATASRTDAGTTNMNLAADQFVNNNTNFANVTFNVTDGYQTVNPINATVTITGHNSTTDYDGKEHTVTGYDVEISNPLYKEADFTFSGTAEAKRTDVGTTNMGLAADQFANKNANFETVTFNVTDGYQTIDPIDVTVTIVGANNTTDYDGEEHTVTGYTATVDSDLYDVTKDFTFSGTAEAKRTDAGTTNMGLTESQFTNTNTNFRTVTFDVTDGYQTIDPIDVTVTITGNNNSTDYDGQGHTVTGYLATASTKLYDVTKDFTFNGTATASRIDAGTTNMNLAADQFENKNTNFRTVTFNVTDGYQTIKPIEVTVTIVGNNSTVDYDGEQHTVTGYTAKAENDLYDVTKDFTFNGTATASRMGAGTTNMGLTADQFTNTNANFTNVTFIVTDGFQKIEPISVQVKIIGNTDTSEYDGEEHTVEGFRIEIGNELYHSSDIVFKGTATASRTDAGTTYMELKAEDFSNNNPCFKDVEFIITDGYQTITPIKVTVKVTEHSDEVTYDGKEHTVTGYDVEISNPLYTEKDFTFSGNDSVSGTDAGTYNMELKSEDFTNNSENFTNVQFEIVDGSLVITPKAVTITTGSDSKAYDGTALTKDEAGIAGLVNGETAEVKATGSQTEVDTSTNTYEITWGTAKAENYEITEELGQLEVTKNNAEVTLTAASDSKTYDGKALTNAEVTATGLPEGFTIEATASGSQTDAGNSANVVNDGYVIKNAAGEDKTANFTNVQKVDGTLTVNPKAVTITTGSDSKAYDGTALTKAEASIESLVEGESVTLAATGTITEVGSTDNTYSITWDNAKEANYTVTENLGTLTITENSSQVTLTAASGSKTYDGSALTDSTVTASGLPEGFTIEATASGSQTDAGNSANVVNDGYVIRNAAGEDKTTNFTNIKKVDGTLTVNPKAVTITTGSDSKAYDGTPLTNAEASIEGLVEGESVTLAATGTITEVGSTDNTYSITWDNAKATNYTVTENLGTLTVTTSDVDVVLTAASDSKTYDGTALTNSTVTASGLPEGFTIEATASGSQTDAGSSANVVNDGYKILDQNGNDKTANFTNVQKVDGTLTVNPKAVTITTGSDSKAYDGTALTKDEADITGLVNGETAEVKATGSQTEVGTGTNTYEITWGTAKAENYEITEELGQLEVTENGAEVTLTAASDSKTYDGTALTNAEVTAAGLPEGFTIEATASGSQTDAGNSANVVNDGYVIKNAAGEDRTANFTKVQKVDGTLTVNPKAVTITTGSDSKAYDGTPLTNSKASIEGLVEGESVTLTATGTITEVGNTANTYSITWDNAKASNYTVTDNLGTLTITENSAEVTLTAASDSKTYDGTALTNAEVTAAGLPDGFTIEATASGTQTDAGSSANVVNDGYRILDQNGNDKTANFTNIKTVEGTLTVNAREITVSVEDKTVEYNGNVQYGNTAYVFSNLVTGHNAVITYTPSEGTLVNTYDNGAYADDLKVTDAEGNDVTKNYSLTTKTAGKLTITDLPDDKKFEITLESNSSEVTYDGTDHTVSGFKTLTFTVNGQTFTVSGVEASVTGTDAGTYTNTITGTPVVRDAEGNDVTAQFIVKPVNGELVINKRKVTLTSAADSKEYDGTPLTNDTVTVGGDGFAEGEGATYDVTGSQLIAGSSDNTFTYKLNENTKAENYEITTAAGKLTVTDRTAKYEITVKANSTAAKYDGSEHTASGFETLTFTVNGQTYTVEGLTTSDPKSTDVITTGNVISGTAVVKDSAGNDVTAQFIVNTENGTLEITKRSIVMTSATDTKEYDGSALTNDTVTVTGDGFAEGEGAVYSVTGSQTLVGSSENTFTYTLNENTKAGNYEISTSYGTLTVTNRGAKYEITVEANSGEFKYDGSAKTVSGFKTLEFTVEGNTYTVEGLSAETVKKDAGEYPVNVVGTPVVKDAAGNDVTAQFAVTTVNGTLKITKRTVVLTSATDTKVYDGTPLTNSEVTVTGDGFAEGEGASYNVTGARTIVGESPNSFTYTLNANTNHNNYEITTVFGTLTVTDRSEDDKYEITVVSNSVTAEYNGREHSAEGFETLTFTVNGQTYTVEGLVTSNPKSTDVTKLTNEITGEAVVRDAEGNDVTDQFNVITENGTLEITPIPVVLTSADDSKVYDGTALTNDTVSMTGFIEGEGADYDVTGTQTLVGSSENTFTYTLHENTKAENYVITTVFGTLTVTDESVDPALVVTKTAEDRVYRLGETVTFTVTAKNIYAETKTIILKEIDGVTLEKSTFENVEPGEEVSAEATYTITETDVLNGSFRNIVTAVIGELEKNAEAAVTVEDKNGHLSVEKITVSEPANGETYVIDESIRYQITVTNDGNLTITDVTVTDELTGDSWTIESLAPGASETFTAVYAVTEQDVLNGEVTNTASAKGTSPDLDQPEADGEASVTDETGKGPGNDVIPEPAPEDEGAEMDAESQSIIVVYDGNEHTVTAKADKEGSTIYYSTDGGVTWSEEAPKRTDAGTTEFAVKAVHPVYEDVIRTGYKLVVLPAEAVIVVDSYTKVYRDADPEWTATVTGLIGDDTFDYELYRDSGENVGVYYIHVGFAGESTEEIKGISWEAETGVSEVTYNKQIGNYNIRVVEGTLTIVPRNVTVTVTDTEKKAGESDPEFKVIVEGLPEGDSIEYVIARDPGEEAGTYTIRVTGETDQGNFTVTFVNGTLTIRPEEKIVPTPEPKPDTPSTGDDSGKWNGTFGFSLIALILAALLRKRYGDEA